MYDTAGLLYNEKVFASFRQLLPLVKISFCEIFPATVTVLAIIIIQYASASFDKLFSVKYITEGTLHINCLAIRLVYRKQISIIQDT